MPSIAGFENATDICMGLMVHDPQDPYRQGYSFANALYAVSELNPGFDKLDMFVVAERVLAEIMAAPKQFPNATMSVR